MIKIPDKEYTVLHLIESAGRGGAETVVAALAESRPHAVHVASLRSGWLQERLASRGVPCGKVTYSRRSDLLLAIRIARLARSADADVIHCHCFAMNTVGALGSALARSPSIATVHGVTYDLDATRRRLAYRLAGRLHRRVVAVSHFLAGRLNSTAGIPLRKLEVVYNGVGQLAPEPGSRDRIRREFGFGADDIVVVSVGMLRPEKGHSDLIAAVSRASRAVPALRLLIVGEGRCREDLERLVSELGLEEVTQLASFRDDVPAILSGSDIFVLPSHEEGLSIATIEAMMCGLSVVATDSGGPAEIVTHGDTGLLVPPHSPPDLASALTLLAEDPALRDRLAVRGRQHAVQAFSLDRMLAGYERIYGEIGPRGGRRSRS